MGLGVSLCVRVGMCARDLEGESLLIPAADGPRSALIGEVGEVCFAGPTVGVGYHNRWTDANELALVALPFDWF